MATVVSGNQVKLSNGQTVTANQGGWYDGQQFFNGTLSAAGVINSQSNQPGAGQAVSSTVNAASAKAQNVTPQNLDTYLQKQGVPSSNSSPINKALDSYGQNLLNSSQAPSVKVQTPEEVKAQLQPSTPLPAVLNRVDEFAKLRTDYGVADLESSLTAIKDQVQQEYNLIAKARGIEEGKPVPIGVISGRISEQERVSQQRIDELGRQQARITDELGTKYNVINQIMQFESLDYNDAVQRYQDEFNMNLKVYDIIAGQKRDARSAYEYDQTAAKANLQIYSNAITNGNLNYDSLEPDQKLMINKLEIQSGLPVGFVSNLKMSAKDRLISVNEKTGEALTVGEDGAFKVIQTGMTKSGTSGDTAQERKDAKVKADFAEMNTILSTLGGKDKILSPAQWAKARGEWAQQGYDVKQFDSAFQQYANPDWGVYVGINDK